MKAIHIISVAIVAVMTSAITSCTIKVEKASERKAMATKTIAIKDFANIFEDSGSRIIYTQGDTFSIRIEAPADEIEQFSFSYSANNDGTLSIQRTWDRMNNPRIWTISGNTYSQATIYITTPTLSQVTVNGSGDFECNDTIQTDEFIAQVHGSGDILVKNVKSKFLLCNVDGSGDINVESFMGEAAEYNVNGSGDIVTNQVNVSETKISINGSGDISLDMKDCDKVTAFLAGSGDIRLTGNANSLSQSSNGSGDIDTSNLKLAP